MKRKRNINFGFIPARPTRADLVKSRREFKSNVRRKVKEMRAEYSRLKKSARSGRTQSTRKLEQLFHEVYGPEQNPRILPEMNDKQLAAIERLIKGKDDMAQKKKRKKRNGRKGTMPAGLKAYWAKKRRSKKSKRRNPSKRRRTNPRRVKVRTRTIVKYRYRSRPKRKRARRRQSNPLRTAKRITLKGFTARQIKTVASIVRRVSGKRVRVAKP